MFESLLNHQWLMAISLFVFMALAIELGYRTGIKFRIGDDQDRKEQVNAIAQGLVVLLSLLLSFTLTMAVSRYDHRRELIVREADAIGTTYLRAATLGQPYQEMWSNYCVTTSTHDSVSSRPDPTLLRL